MKLEPIKTDPREEQLLALLLDQETEHALILLDENRRVVAWRGGATKMFGYGFEEMYGATLDRIFTPEDRERGELDNEYDTALSYGRADDDRWMVRQDNMRIWVSGVLTVLRTENGTVKGFSKIFRERTEIRTQLDTLRNRAEEALQAEHRRNIFIGTLAHELRNPLGRLSNAAELIRLSFGKQPEIVYPLSVIQRQVRFIAGLVDDMLDVTRIGTGKLLLNIATVELRQIIDEAIETCRSQIKDKQQAVEVLMPSITLEADALRLQQVLVNVIGNASKFSPENSKIWIKSTVEGVEAVVRVEDKGRGIPGELLPGIFELFTQASAPPRDDAAHSGLGLGLTLVKSFVELHHGTVQARSEGIGQGLEMIIRLPLKQPDASSSERAGHSSEQTP